MNNHLLNEINDFLNTIKNSEDAKSYAQKCFDPNTPSHEISIMDVYSNISILYTRIPKEKRSRFDELCNKLIKKLEDIGYRIDYYTYQEHKLMGSTSFPIYEKNPYKPTGITDGNITVEEANTARKLAKRQSALGAYFLEEDIITISLEPLDECGNTVRDPQVLNDDLNPILTKYSPDFPFRRN